MRFEITLALNLKSCRFVHAREHWAYMEAALDHLRQQGVEFSEAGVARLSPLRYKHVNMLGHYSFMIADFITQGKLRPLNLAQIEP